MVNAGLTGTDVLDAVGSALEHRGWVVEERTTGLERWRLGARGPDGRHLTVEARGARCEKTGSIRRGRPYTRDEIASQIARSFHSLATTGDDDLRAMALPATPAHRAYVKAIAQATGRFSIGVFWVDEEGTTELDAPWSLEA